MKTLNTAVTLRTYACVDGALDLSSMFTKSDRPTGKEGLADRISRLKECKPVTGFALPPQHKYKERAPRQPTYKNAVLILQSGQKLVVAIKDLSVGGARIEARERLALSEEVLLTEGTLNLRRRARVVWRRDGAAGLQFIEG